MKKKQSGITLVALVITIIILLILAGISIQALTNTGLFARAKEAKTETRGASVQEAKDLWKMNQELDNYGEDATAQTLEELLNDLEKQKLITSEERTTIEETGEVTIGSKTIVFKEKSIADYVKIGDYVDYHPDDVTTVYDKFGETYSGYANEDIGQDDSLGWRILNINEDEGTIELISDKPTSTQVYFCGARGYNNGVALLNDYCKTMYSNKSKGAVARSLNIEDIQDKMKVDETTGKKAYESYTSETGTAYKTGTYSYYSINRTYPLQWKNDNGIEEESKPKNPDNSDIIQYETDAVAKSAETTGDLTVTQTLWELNSSTMSTNFETADTRDTTKANSMYYELLCNKGSSNYWLASRSVDTRYSGYALFGLRYVGTGSIVGRYMLISNNALNTGFYYVRPVVSIPSSAIDISIEYNESTGWELK